MMNKADPTSSKGVPSSDVHCGYGGDVNLRNFRGNLLQGGGEGEGRRIVGGRRKEAGQSHTRIKALPPFVLSPPPPFSSLSSTTMFGKENTRTTNRAKRIIGVECLFIVSHM